MIALATGAAAATLGLPVAPFLLAAPFVGEITSQSLTEKFKAPEEPSPTYSDLDKLKAEVIESTVKLGVKPQEIRDILNSELAESQKKLEKLHEIITKAVSWMSKC